MIVPANKSDDDVILRLILISLAIAFAFCALALYAYPQVMSVDAALIYTAISIAFFASCCWLLGWLSHRTYRRRLARLSRRSRSPWGKIRTAEPSPYGDRLAKFVSTAREAVDTEIANASHNDSADPYGSIGDPTFRSRMSYWSAVDVPQDPEPPKPTWFIRRVLRRIREALVGYQR